MTAAGALALASCSGEGNGAAAGRTENAVVEQPASTPTSTPTSTSASTTDPAASQVNFADLAGTWTVTGVSVGDGVGALATDDPAYMGRKLTISAERLAWLPAAAGASTAGTTDDVCGEPVTQRIGGAKNAEYADQLSRIGKASDAHAIECDTGNWGPAAAGGATLFGIDKDTLAMSWYDGALLKLTRS